jgi:molybdate transport system permease protein
VVVFKWTGAALAAGVMGFPLMVRAVRLSFEAVDRRLEAAASTLGAGRLAVFATVTLPLALPGVITGMLLSFARGLGEFGATITFVSNIPGETRTLPLAIYTYTQVPAGDEFALRLSLIAVLLSLAALFVSEALVRRAARRITGDDADSRH